MEGCDNVLNFIIGLLIGIIIVPLGKTLYWYSHKFEKWYLKIIKNPLDFLEDFWSFMNAVL